MKIYSVHDKEFAEYGKLLTGIDCTELIAAMQETPAPDDVIYVPSDEKLEKLPVFQALTEKGFGGIPIQLGYCNGTNCMLNALEYHRSSEINVACTDLILLLGREQDIEPDGRYDTAKVMAFLVPAGTAILYPSTSSNARLPPRRRMTVAIISQTERVWGSFTAKSSTERVCTASGAAEDASVRRSITHSALSMPLL